MALVQERKGTLAGHAVPAVVSLKNVLFATDFSPTSEAALPYAAAICRHFGSTLHAVHVLSDTSLLLMTGGVDYISLGTMYESAQIDAREKLDRMARRFQGIAHQNYVRHGRIWENLEHIIAENEIDLIVVGTHGRTGLGKLLLGSVAEDILRHAPCPVLTVGPQVSGLARLPELSGGGEVAPVELEIRQIVFATNFAHSAPLLAQAAVSLAGEFRAKLTMVHVIEDYTQLGKDPGSVEESVQHLRELIPADAVLQYNPEILVEFGSGREQILKIASNCDADLLVLGARNAAEVRSTHLPWCTSQHVIAHAHCPVLTLRA